jgi:hypothetical protein
MKKIDFFNIGLNPSDHFFLYQQIMMGKSYMRATHNLFLKKKLTINNFTGDLGAGGKNDYNKYIFKDLNLVKNFDFYKTKKNTIKLNLEKNFNLKKYRFKSILIFNVFEHIFNKEILLNSISKSLSKNGKLEIFVPFMYKYHGDPHDYYRFTQSFLKKFLENKGFKVKIILIGTGQFNVILEILFKYFKLNILKIIISPIFIILNKIFYFTSKDFKNYYCGIHCSCIKVK